MPPPTVAGGIMFSGFPYVRLSICLWCKLYKPCWKMLLHNMSVRDLSCKLSCWCFKGLRWSPPWNLISDAVWLWATCICHKLMNSYSKQIVHAWWQGKHSSEFDVCNGVRHGRVLSPNLFTWINWLRNFRMLVIHSHSVLFTLCDT